MSRLWIAAALCAVFTPALADDASVKIPTDQRAFNSAVEHFREAYDKASNDLAKGAQRPKRGKAICATLRKRKAVNWTGFVTELTSNGDGYGVLTVKTGDKITVGTANNALSDIGSDTLIKPESPVLDQAAGLAVGQAVRFSGTFIADKVDCAKEMSVTLSGSMDEPAYLFRFSKVEPIGDAPVTNPAGKSLLKRMLE